MGSRNLFAMGSRQLKLAVAILSGIHLAAIRSHDGFYAYFVVHNQTRLVLLKYLTELYILDTIHR